MPESKNLRTMGAPQPKDSKKSLEPGAREGKDWNSTNEVREYVADNPPTGGQKGGQNAGL